MDWPEATELVVEFTGHGHYRRLTADDHPDHEVWRSRMPAKAAAILGMPPPPIPPNGAEMTFTFDQLEAARARFEATPPDQRPRSSCCGGS